MNGKLSAFHWLQGTAWVSSDQEPTAVTAMTNDQLREALLKLEGASERIHMLFGIAYAQAPGPQGDHAREAFDQELGLFAVMEPRTWMRTQSLYQALLSELETREPGVARLIQVAWFDDVVESDVMSGTRWLTAERRYLDITAMDTGYLGKVRALLVRKAEQLFHAHENAAHMDRAGRELLAPHEWLKETVLFRTIEAELSDRTGFCAAGAGSAI